MCSQPPTRHDDSWLVEEASQVARHIRRGPAILGFTGGEPLLLGDALRQVLLSFSAALPETLLEVLTNGRLLGDASFAARILDGLPRRVAWMVPLYGHADFLHDEVVQSDGAFEQTLGGLLNLQAFGQPVQLRIVLIEPVLEHLPEFCSFVAKNLPFVREVALMGCEPVGLALANQTACNVDLREWSETLLRADRILRRAGLPVLLMNTPLCALPAELWPYAQKSISDWKNVYPPECSSCSVRNACCGLFVSQSRGWRPTVLRPVLEEVSS